MRWNFNTLWNLLFIAVICFFLWQRVPGFLENYRSQGELAPKASVALLTEKGVQQRDIPFSTGRQAIVFWATWCGPCKLELGRVQKLIADKKLNPRHVLAISVGEEESVVRAFVREQAYTFDVALDPQGLAADKYKVAGTPTLLIINESGKIDWKTVGISPSLEIRLSRL